MAGILSHEAGTVALLPSPHVVVDGSVIVIGFVMKFKIQMRAQTRENSKPAEHQKALFHNSQPNQTLTLTEAPARHTGGAPVI